MIEQMLAWDKEVILWIHRNLHSNIGDIIIPWLRKPTFWIPLYILIIYIFIKWWKARGLIVVAILGSCVGVSDIISVHLFKNIFQRLRPCHTLMDNPDFNLLVNCGGKYGFVSSHAVNHMAMAVFLFYLFKHRVGKYHQWWILWAIIIGFAQVYVGVHYPLDVLCGFVIGGVIGWGFAYCTQRFFPEFMTSIQIV